MTEMLFQSVNSRSDTFPRNGLMGGLDGCRSSRYYPEPNHINSELKHSKSDDLILQSDSINESFDSDDVEPRPLSPNLPFENSNKMVTSDYNRPKSSYFSDSEPDVSNIKVRCVPKVSNPTTRHVGLYDSVDPEDSIRDMISENDFYRFVLFKTHYDKYLRLSLKYEEARNIAYYLEEKYHEIKTERDGLAEARREIERKLETKELELHEKEEELFLQLEKVIRLEEDCEKLRAEKEKFSHWKDKLERERNEAYAQLKLQAQEAETTRRGLERARQEVVRQCTVISAEKDFLERENEKLKERLEMERAGADHCLMDLSHQKAQMSQNVMGLEKEVSQLKLAAKHTATLNSQLKKAMKHLATCKRKKCSVCAYTKATFGELAGRNDKKLFTCFQAPFQDIRNWMRPVPGQELKCLPDSSYPCCGDDGKDGTCSGCHPSSSPFPSVRSEYSFRRSYSIGRGASSSPSPSPSLPLSFMINPHLSYIDDASTVSDDDSGHVEESFNIPQSRGESSYTMPPCPVSMSACTCSLGPDTPAPPANRAFSSDSGFSSELYDTKLTTSTPKPKLERSKWTASFRKLIHRVSKKPNEA